MFRIGQKVVCVKPDSIKISRRVVEATTFLSKGEVYEISWVGPFPYEPDAITGDYGVRLVGINRGPDPFPLWDDYPYSATRFRPLVEKKTDISVFNALLNPANHKHLEGV